MHHPHPHNHPLPLHACAHPVQLVRSSHEHMYRVAEQVRTFHRSRPSFMVPRKVVGSLGSDTASNQAGGPGKVRAGVVVGSRWDPLPITTRGTVFLSHKRGCMHARGKEVPRPGALGVTYVQVASVWSQVEVGDETHTHTHAHCLFEDDPCTIAVPGIGSTDSLLQCGGS